MKHLSTDKLEKYWIGSRIKHFDSVPYLSSPHYTLHRAQAVLKRTLCVESSIQIKKIRDIGRFLRKCKYLSDKKQFGKSDYWQTPDEFEKNKSGDCEDFSLWSWRKFIELGVDARFTYGTQDMKGHAWVTIFKEDVPYIFEATRKPKWTGELVFNSAESATNYIPRVSVDKNIHFFKHKI